MKDRGAPAGIKKSSLTFLAPFKSPIIHFVKVTHE